MFSRVYVEITNICNMSCSFCHGHSRSPKMMSTDEFSIVLDKLQGVTKYIYYHLMGEPLVHPELPSFLKMASRKGFNSIITTNGTLLGKRADELLSSLLHKISISVHSFEKGSEDDYYRYLSEISLFAKKASENGVITVLRLWNVGYDEGRNDATLEFFRSFFGENWSENMKGFKIDDKLFLEYGDRFMWPDESAEIHGDSVYCYGMRQHFGVLCDGSVVPCCLDSDGVMTLGNIFTDDLEAMLGSQRVVNMVKGFENRKATEELCRRCGYAQKFSL